MVNLPIVRGDDVSYPIALYTTYVSEGSPSNVELDITGRSYASKVAVSKGGAVVVTPTVTVTNASTGKITWSLTDTDTDLLTDARYVWDLVENPGTNSERTLIVGTLNMVGRATP
jgi:hypothetical protein